MLVIPPTIAGTYESNLTPSSGAREGTTITAHATTAHDKGDYSILIDPTSKPSYGIYLILWNSRQSGQIRSFLLDIAYGPTGGGNEEIVIPDLNAGACDDTYDGGKTVFFPVYVPTGVAVSARCQANTTGDTVKVMAWLVQDPLYPWVAGPVDAYGVDASNSRGTTLAGGNNAYGSWVQIVASTNRAHRFWTVMQDAGSDSGLSNITYLAQIGIGPDSGNVTVIAGPFRFGNTTGEAIGGPFPLLQYAPVPSGSRIWVRVGADTQVRGYVVYGVD